MLAVQELAGPRVGEDELTGGTDQHSAHIHETRQRADALPRLASPFAIQIQLLLHAMGGREGRGEIVLGPGFRELLEGGRSRRGFRHSAAAPPAKQENREAEAAGQRQGDQGPGPAAAQRGVIDLGSARHVRAGGSLSRNGLPALPVSVTAAHQQQDDQADADGVPCQGPHARVVTLH